MSLNNKNNETFAMRRMSHRNTPKMLDENTKSYSLKREVVNYNDMPDISSNKNDFSTRRRLSYGDMYINIPHDKSGFKRRVPRCKNLSDFENKIKAYSRRRTSR